MSTVYISIGSNIDREANIRSAIQELQRCFGALQLSSVYESKAIGFEGPAFYNLVAAFETQSGPQEVHQALQDIESRHGRRRDGVRHGSRTLDLDLLLYDDVVLSGADLRLPRTEITRYAFVLQPLAEIAADRRHPVNGHSFAELWASFDRDSQPLRRVDNCL